MKTPTRSEFSERTFHKIRGVVASSLAAAVVAAAALLGAPTTASAAPINTYYYSAEIPFPLNSPAAFSPFGNTTLSGSFDVDQGNLGSPQPLTLNFSNGNTVTANVTWGCQAFGGQWLISSSGVNAPFNPNTSVAFSRLFFFTTTPCNPLATGGSFVTDPVFVGQLNLLGGGTSIGISIRNGGVTTTPPTTDNPPIANAGADFSVNEGELAVMLDGTGSSDPDSDPLSYAWSQTGGTLVSLTGASTAQPTFDAPIVAIGGETLSFELTVTANGEMNSDSVDVTVANINAIPVADANSDQTVPEDTLVTLFGGDSFDNDNDTLTYAWVQVGPGITVTLDNATAVSPTFTSPLVGAGGETLSFELTVNDGFDSSAPDTVSIDVTNVNLPPIADAGADDTKDENTTAVLNGGASSDPDGDPLTYDWQQTAGPLVTLDDNTLVSPSFTTPFVSAGGDTLTFTLTVDDGFGAANSDSVDINVLNENDPPNVDLAQPTISCIWPPNHKLVEVGITGAFDPDGDATLTIDGVTQDEPTNGLGDGDTAIDAVINGDGTVLLRAERSGTDDGRVYHIAFTASDLEGSSSGVVDVCVRHSKKNAAVDNGSLFDSTQ